MRQGILKLLYRSLDAELGGRDRARLEAALRGSEELRQAKAEILRIRGVAADSAARSFKPGFADKVLAGVRSDRKAQTDEAVFEFFQELFKPIAVAVSVLLVLLVVYSVTRGDLVPRGEVYYASDITMNKVLELSSF